MTVTFYQFAKKQNSTKQPTASPGTTAIFFCSLKAPCSQLQPVLELQLEDETVAPVWNYAYIKEFHRYYFVTDWTYAGTEWIASLSVDALATYKTDIGSTNAYITRSAYSFDGAITDSLYPMKSSFTVQQASVQLYPSNQVGYYCVGVVGKPFTSAEPTGGITYIVLNTQAFNEFRTGLFDDDLAYSLSGNASKDVGITNFGISMLKLVFDPFEYVRSVCWMPSKPPVKTGTYYVLKVGFWQFSVTNGVQLYDPSVAPSYPTRSLSIPKRVDTARGTYVHCAPYTEYKVYIPTVGYLSLDTSKLLGASTLYIELRMDPIAQTSYVKLMVSYSVGVFTTLGVYEAGLVVPVQLAQSGVNLGREGFGYLQSTMDMANSIRNKDPNEAFEVWKGIWGPTGIFSPSIQTVSNNGGFSWLTDNYVIIYAWFYDLMDDDNTDLGRPLMKVGTPSSYPGYMVCQDCHVAVATAEPKEIEMIAQAMTSGFYYE